MTTIQLDFFILENKLSSKSIDQLGLNNSVKLSDRIKEMPYHKHFIASK